MGRLVLAQLATIAAWIDSRQEEQCNPEFTSSPSRSRTWERALAFYRDGLGLQTDGVIGTEFVGSDVRDRISLMNGDASGAAG
jgi:hypothetical protein